LPYAIATAHFGARFIIPLKGQQKKVMPTHKPLSTTLSLCSNAKAKRNSRLNKVRCGLFDCKFSISCLLNEFIIFKNRFYSRVNRFSYFINQFIFLENQFTSIVKRFIFFENQFIAEVNLVNPEKNRFNILLNRFMPGMN
jgi:hypothetical protein